MTGFVTVTVSVVFAAKNSTKLFVGIAVEYVFEAIVAVKAVFLVRTIKLA